MKWLVKLILLSSLTSCSAQWHLKKAVQKDPLILVKDTLVVTDTVVSPPVAITDTVIMKQHDTITLVKEKLRVNIVKVNDTITIDAICESDTIVRVVEIPYEKIVYVEQKSFMDKLYGIIAALFSAIVAFRIIRYFIERWV